MRMNTSGISCFELNKAGGVRLESGEHGLEPGRITVPGSFER